MLFLTGNSGVCFSAAVSIFELSSTFHYQKCSFRMKSESFRNRKFTLEGIYMCCLMVVCCIGLFKAVELCWINSYQNEMRVSTLFLSFMVMCVKFLRIREQADSCLSNLNFYLRGKHYKPDHLYLFIFSYFPGFSWVFPFKESLNGVHDTVVQNASIAAESKLHLALAEAYEKQCLPWSLRTTHLLWLWLFCFLTDFLLVV